MSKAFLVKSGVTLLVIAAFWAVANADEVETLLSDIERLGKLGREAPSQLTESVADRVEKHATNVSAFLVKRLLSPGLSEETLAVYIGVLGLTKHTNAVPGLTDFFKQTQSETLKHGCFASLASIGGEQAITFLLRNLESETDKERRFNLLNCLAQTRHESVLPKTVEVLECDPRSEYWKAVFVFGKMGDKAVPFLVNRINDTNRNIRFNAIYVLGQWELAPEALQPLRERFWKEEDEGIRDLIGNSVTQIALGETFTEFLGQVVAKGKDKKAVERARQALDEFPKAKANFLSLKKTRSPSAESFQREYSLLFKSAGRKGDYEMLAKSSTLADESALKRLRERILQRDSDEAFYDYKKVSEIIWQNRFFADLK
jgi:HEAT repeat protein